MLALLDVRHPAGASSAATRSRSTTTSLKAGVFRASGLQDTITRMAPVLLVGAGLIVAFRAGLWNLGADGQYLLAAAFVAGVGPCAADASVPVARRLGRAGAARGMAVGAAWTIVPAWLKARYGLNEIVTTLMMSFIGVGPRRTLLVKGPFNGPSTVPQTAVHRPGGDARGPAGHAHPHRRVRGAVVVVRRRPLAAHADVVRHPHRRAGRQPAGSGPRGHRRAAADRRRPSCSAAGSSVSPRVDILGIFGYMRADWDPAYGLKVVPLVFLARLNALARHPVRGVLRRDVHRRRLRDATRGPAQRLPAAAHRA